MPELAEILTPGRTACRIPGVSKKRLFETIAKIINRDQVSLPYSLVLSSLISREKLGSTGLGHGIAIPHCRIDNCTHAMGVLVTLEEAIDFDAPDNQPVDMLFVLLVPQEAEQKHLDILASVAGLFSQDEFCNSIRNAKDTESLYATAVNWAQ
ncbi:MAG: PTS IIA-like nitrogen regulatory protein PtsN [Halioglobus sp.]